jgi:hypothetical protein
MGDVTMMRFLVAQAAVVTVATNKPLSRYEGRLDREVLNAQGAIRVAQVRDQRGKSVLATGLTLFLCELAARLIGNLLYGRA